MRYWGKDIHCGFYGNRLMKLAVGFIITVATVVGLPAFLFCQEENPISTSNEMELILEGNLLKINLNLSGAQTVGFENAPLSRDEKWAVDDALRKLNDIRRLHAFPQIAGCNIDYYETKADPGPISNEKLTIRANYRFLCKSPRSLNRIKLLYFDKFEDLSEVKATAKGPWGEHTSLVTPSNTMLRLTKPR